MKKKNYISLHVSFVVITSQKGVPSSKIIVNNLKNLPCRRPFFLKKNNYQFGGNQNWTYKIENKHLLKPYLVNIFRKMLLVSTLYGPDVSK